jgi:hypothetical protein
MCQRFILKPETPHIICMKSIPGIIEESKIEWSISGQLQATGSSGSGSQYKLSSEGLPSSKRRSLKPGETSADIGPLDLESTSSGKYTIKFTSLI